jgi:antitoxin MazE
MKSRIVPIGNSRGVRIPKPLLEQIGLAGEVEMTVQEGSLIIRPTRRPRAGWARAFEAMACQGDDVLLDAGTLPSTRWDEEEWEWR